MICYQVVAHHPSAHIFRVTMHISAELGALHPNLKLRLPAWVPGSYMVRDFAKNIIAISAGDVPITKIDKSTWQLENITGEVRVCCDIYAWDLSVRAAHLDEHHGFFNGSALFLQPLDVDCAFAVEIIRPEGERYKNWRVATTLPSAGAAAYGFGRYKAADYDELIDHPVELGEFSLYEFNAAVEHAIAITGKHSVDSARLCADLQKLCSYQQSLFGSKVPFSRYLFLCTVTGSDYGGLEHRSSSALIASRYDLPYKNMHSMSDEYVQFLGLCSHEYFHLWNVKRIKPAAFTPYDLSCEQHTELLWAFEGFTAYYDDLSLVRAGLIDTAKYLQLLARGISRVLATPGRKVQCLAAASFDAWTKFYKTDENTPNATVSYYVKGATAAFCLDVLIREASGNTKSLDDVMRMLWQRYWQDPQGRATGVPERGIFALCHELLGSAHTQKLDDFFAKAIYGTEDLDVTSAFAYMGIDCVLSDHGAGDFVASLPAKTTAKPSFGARLGEDAAGVRLQSLALNGAAMQAGLAAGDLIIAIDGVRATTSLLTKLLARAQVGDCWQISAFRRDELLSVELKLQAAVPEFVILAANQNASSAACHNQRLWLHGA